MKKKNSLTAFTKISVAALAIAVTLSYTSPSQAIEINLAATDSTTVKEQVEEAPTRIDPSAYTRVGKATYTLRNPTIQFDYDPNFFVLDVSETFSETVNPSSQTPWVSSVYLWTKKDYMLRENSGDELGDFPNKLNISVDENPEGLPLQDWIVTQRNLSVVENVRKLESTIAGREAWGFSHRSLFEYDNIVFRDELGRVIMLSSLSTLPNEVTATATRTEPVINAKHYVNALSMLVDSIELTMPIPDTSNQ